MRALECSNFDEKRRVVREFLKSPKTSFDIPPVSEKVGPCCQCENVTRDQCWEVLLAA